MELKVCESQHNLLDTGAVTGVGKADPDIYKAATLAQDDALARARNAVNEALAESKKQARCQPKCEAYYYYQIDFMPASTVSGSGKYVATMPMYWNLYLDCHKSRPAVPPRPEALPPTDPDLPTGPSARAIYLLGSNWGKLEAGPDGPILKPPKDKDEKQKTKPKKGKIEIR